MKEWFKRLGRLIAGVEAEEADHARYQSQSLSVGDTDGEADPRKHFGDLHDKLHRVRGGVELEGSDMPIPEAAIEPEVVVSRSGMGAAVSKSYKIKRSKLATWDWRRRELNSPRGGRRTRRR